VHFRLTQDNRYRLPERLAKGEVALLLSVRPERRDMEWRHIVDQELVAIVPIGHRLAERETVRLVELADEPFVGFKHNTALRDQIDDLCRKVGFSPMVGSECDDSTTLGGLVANGAGIAIIPEGSAAASHGVVTLGLDEPDAYRAIGVTWIADRFLSRAERAFLDFVLGERVDHRVERLGAVAS
jgi:DNA-binding transcriptional LysR family regulator